MEEGGIIGGRKSRRSRVLLCATLDVAGILLMVKLRNLSEVGALVEGDCLPAEGSVICFRRKDLRLKSTVVWVKGRCAGIAFERQLKAAEILRHIATPRRITQQRFRRPGFGWD
jgi:PilZ domain